MALDPLALSEERDLLSLLLDPPGLGQGDVGGRVVESLPGQELLDGADLQLLVVAVPAGRMVIAGAEAGADAVGEGRSLRSYSNVGYAHYHLLSFALRARPPGTASNRALPRPHAPGCKFLQVSCKCLDLHAFARRPGWHFVADRGTARQDVSFCGCIHDL